MLGSSLKGLNQRDGDEDFFFAVGVPPFHFGDSDEEWKFSFSVSFAAVGADNYPPVFSFDFGLFLNYH